MKYLILFIVAFSLATGCKKKDTGGADAKEKILAVVRAESMKNGDFANGDIDVTHTNGTWTVVVWTLPKTPDKFTTYTVSDDGKITNVQNGH